MFMFVKNTGISLDIEVQADEQKTLFHFVIQAYFPVIQKMSPHLDEDFAF